MITVRRAGISDAAVIQLLNKECLGYDYPLSEVETHLQALLENPGHEILVGVLDEELVVGYLHLADYDTLYFEPMKNILGIAVFTEFRRRGVATRLLSAGEQWARDTGATGIRLVSGVSREEAHAFYERMGYEMSHLQKNFRKML